MDSMSRKGRNVWRKQQPQQLWRENTHNKFENLENKEGTAENTGNDHATQANETVDEGSPRGKNKRRNNLPKHG